MKILLTNNISINARYRGKWLNVIKDKFGVFIVKDPNSPLDGSKINKYYIEKIEDAAEGLDAESLISNCIGVGYVKEESSVM